MRLLDKIRWIRALPAVAEAVEAAYHVLVEWEKGDLEEHEIRRAFKEFMEAIIALGLLKEK